MYYAKLQSLMWKIRKILCRNSAIYGQNILTSYHLCTKYSYIIPSVHKIFSHHTICTQNILGLYHLFTKYSDLNILQVGQSRWQGEEIQKQISKSTKFQNVLFIQHWNHHRPALLKLSHGACFQRWVCTWTPPTPVFLCSPRRPPWNRCSTFESKINTNNFTNTNTTNAAASTPIQPPPLPPQQIFHYL